MHFLTFGYSLIFILSATLLLRNSKIQPSKQFYANFPNQHKCLTRHIYWYERDLAIELFEKLPIFINQCSFRLLRPYFEEIVTNDGNRSALFLPREKPSFANDKGLLPYSEFLSSDDDECTIVHVTNNGVDNNLEMMMKEKYPECKVVKIDAEANFREQDSSVEIVPAKLILSFDEEKNEHGTSPTVDLETLISVILKSTYIEALYLDESVPYFDFWRHFKGDEISRFLPVCQVTVVIEKPKNRNEVTEFWNFVSVFLLDLRLVLVSSRRITKTRIDVVFYNAKNEMCNFKHFSIPYDWRDKFQLLPSEPSKRQDLLSFIPNSLSSFPSTDIIFKQHVQIYNKKLADLYRNLEKNTKGAYEEVKSQVDKTMADTEETLKNVADNSKKIVNDVKNAVKINIPIKILGQPHTHSRSNSSSSGDNERFSQPPQSQPQQTQQPQQPSQHQQQSSQQSQQIPTINTSNMNHPNSNGFSSNFPSRSPIPDFPNFPSSAFGNDREDWMNFPSFPNFPSNFARDSNNFPNFPSFGRDGGLSPNPTMQNMRRSPTPTRTASPSATLRRNSQQGANGSSTAHPGNAPTSSAANSRPSSRMSRERETKTNDVPERPAVIPLPYEKSSSSIEKDGKRNSADRDVIEENIAKITVGKNDRMAEKKGLNVGEEIDGDPSPLTSPISDGKLKKGKKLQRKQSVADFNAKTIVSLDKIEIQVEQLRKKAAELEMEKDQILRSLGEISVHNCMLKLAECDREEIEAITERLTKRTKTVQVVVETPRNEEQKKALEEATKMMDSVNDMMQTNIEKAKVCLQTYINACSSEETTGATCQNFLKVIIQCAADDQKRIKRRLASLMSQIENAEAATADLIDEESE